MKWYDIIFIIVSLIIIILSLLQGGKSEGASGAITGGMKQKLIEHFDTHEELAHMLKMRARPGDVILFKGSRGMRMEKALSLFLKEEKS